MKKYTLKTVYHIMCDGNSILDTEDQAQAFDVMRRLNKVSAGNDNSEKRKTCTPKY